MAAAAAAAGVGARAAGAGAARSQPALGEPAAAGTRGWPRAARAAWCCRPRAAAEAAGAPLRAPWAGCAYAPLQAGRHASQPHSGPQTSRASVPGINRPAAARTLYFTYAATVGKTVLVLALGLDPAAPPPHLTTCRPLRNALSCDCWLMQFPGSFCSSGSAVALSSRTRATRGLQGQGTEGGGHLTMGQAAAGPQR